MTVSRLFRLKVLLPVVGVVLVGGFLLTRGGADDLNGATALVARNDLIQLVSVTGRVKPAEDAMLAFERGGKIGSVSAIVGKEVSRGEVLVRLENSDLSAALLQAEASQKVAEAQLNEVLRGSRPEEVAITEARLKSAQGSVLNAMEGLADSIRFAYTVSDDAVRNRADQLFANPNSGLPTLTIQVSDFQLKINIETARKQLSSELASWQAKLVSVHEDSNVMTIAEESITHASIIRSFVDIVSLAVNSLTPTSGLSQATIDAYKASIGVARTNVNSGIDSLNTALASFRTAVSNRTVAEQELFLITAGASQEAIAAAEARLEEAKAAVLSAEAAFSKSVLRAPFSGIVTKVDAKSGQIASANTPLVWMISSGEFEIEANIPEADIAKLAIGNQATTTLDAYSSDIFFPATVSRIDPAETLVDNVATYKVVFRFLGQDPRIKSGMTANIDVLTERRTGVLSVPVRAVLSRPEGGRYVFVLDTEGKKIERTVTTGIRAEGGLIEILDGLTEGERVSLER